MQPRMLETCWTSCARLLPPGLCVREYGRHRNPCCAIQIMFSVDINMIKHTGCACQHPFPNPPVSVWAEKKHAPFPRYAGMSSRFPLRVQYWLQLRRKTATIDGETNFKCFPVLHGRTFRSIGEGSSLNANRSSNFI